MNATSLDGITGHALAVAAMRRQIGDGSLPHALLISGPERVGKTTLALAVASAVLSGETWPGGPRAHPDLWVEDSDAETIGVDRVRAGGHTEEGPSIQEFFAIRPYAGGDRVAVIGRADRLNDQAANMLLKLIEEPPAGCHILLCSSAPERLPATILSRCQTLSLAPVPATALASWLQSAHGIDAALATTAASLALGRPGRALRLATEPGALGAELDALDGFISVAGGGVAGALAAAAMLAPGGGAEGRERALLQLGAWTGFLRDTVCVAEGQESLVRWSDYRPVIDSWANALPRERLVAMLGSAMTATQDIAGNAAPRLCYEVLFVDLFGGIGDPAPPATAIPARSAGVAAAPSGELAARAKTASKGSKKRR